MGKKAKTKKMQGLNKGKLVELVSPNGERWRGMMVGVVDEEQYQAGRNVIEITGDATNVSISHDSIVIAGNFKRHDGGKISFLLSPDEQMTLRRILEIDNG